ncbi:HmuY family protein [Tenacibaculum geojense]|uniref:HmuY family protein n=1 Tax=Tenacibaculum geojense TaxID=915352 RepID=A0ABW3JQY1_9FLAO
MKQFKTLVLVAIISLGFASCSDDETISLVDPNVSSQMVNLHAPVITDYTQNPPVTSGEFTKFSFSTGAVVTGENWDVAFRGTSIIVNGGSEIGLTDEPSRTGNGAIALENGIFTEVVTAPSDEFFTQDAANTYALPTGSGNGWYTYNGQTHLISPVLGTVIIVKTHNGHYAKMEILSYYKDGDSSDLDNSRYYTFNYSYNPNQGDKNLQ